MPMKNAFSLGHDIAVDFNLPQGPVRFTIITDVSRKQIVKDIESHGIDGICRYAKIPSGYEGTLEVDRGGPAFDRAIATLDQLYYSGAPVPYSSILEAITEPDGSLTRWRLAGVVFGAEDLGSWKGDSKVTQKLAWKASLRQEV